MNNKGATIESIKLLQSLLDNRCGENSFESRLFRYLTPSINVCVSNDTCELSHEEEICCALADVFNN